MAQPGCSVAPFPEPAEGLRSSSSPIVRGCRWRGQAQFSAVGTAPMVASLSVAALSAMTATWTASLWTRDQSACLPSRMWSIACASSPTSSISAAMVGFGPGNLCRARALFEVHRFRRMSGANRTISAAKPRKRPEFRPVRKAKNADQPISDHYGRGRNRGRKWANGSKVVSEHAFDPILIADAHCAVHARVHHQIGHRRFAIGRQRGFLGASAR